jgi:PAS domain S-box-containing protein
MDAIHPGPDKSELTPARSAQSSAMAQLMIDSIHDYAVFMLDPAGNVLSWNIGAARIMGYATNEIIGFETINDTFGHAAGDRALQLVVEQMSGQLRGNRNRVVTAPIVCGSAISRG